MYKYDNHNECKNDNDYIKLLEEIVYLYDLQLADLRAALIKNIKKIGD